MTSRVGEFGKRHEGTQAPDSPATHPTKRRTFAKVTWDDAQAAWETGHFFDDDWKDEWEETRKLAAKEGDIIAAPVGTRWDRWDVEGPTQRAIIARAMDETPELLKYAIRAKGAPTWAKVVAFLVMGRDEIRGDIRREEHHDRTQKAERATPSQDAYSVGQIMTILKDSS